MTRPSSPSGYLGLALIVPPLMTLVMLSANERARAQQQPPQLPLCSGRAMDWFGQCSPPKACGAGGVCNSWVVPSIVATCNAPGAVAGDNCRVDTTIELLCGTRGECTFDQEGECVAVAWVYHLTHNPVYDGGACRIPSPPT